MPKYKYEYTNSKGEQVTGEVTADNQDDALAQLKDFQSEVQFSAGTNTKEELEE